MKLVRALIVLIVALMVGWKVVTLLYVTAQGEATLAGAGRNGTSEIGASGASPISRAQLARPQLPPLESPWDQDLLKQLTGSIWHYGNNLSNTSDYRLTFNGDGTSQILDCTNATGSCREIQTLTWNFRALDAKTGLLLFSDGSIRFFRIADGQIWLDHQKTPLPAVATSPASTDRHILPNIPFLDTYRKIIANAWKQDRSLTKNNSPESIVFLPNLTFQATFNDKSLPGFWTPNKRSEPDGILLHYVGGSDYPTLLRWYKDGSVEMLSQVYEPDEIGSFKKQVLNKFLNLLNIGTQESR